jgi:diguanylate cyclase (GGDEF)-like protein
MVRGGGLGRGHCLAVSATSYLARAHSSGEDRTHISTIRLLTGLLTPGGVVLLAAWALGHEETVRTAASPYAAYFCYGALATAVLLSWYYDQARLLCIALALGLTVWGLGYLPIGAEAARLAAIFLLPLNFMLFEWLSEAGVMTLSGLVRIGFVSIQVLGVAWLGLADGGPLKTLLQWGSNAVGWTWLPLVAQISFGVAAIALVVLLFLRRTKVEQGLVWALFAVFLGFNQHQKPEMLLFYCGAAGLILVFAVLEHGYEIANRDELTGLPGRRAFNNLLGQLGKRYAIAMCDVDHFKKFNDTYGHDAGDQVLRMVASKVSAVGGGGQAFRYGGEEFVIVFRGRSASEAKPFLEALCKVISQTGFVPRSADRPPQKPQPLPEQKPKPSVTITISAGLAEQSKRHSTAELVLDDADAALYRAKESGRNCVIVAESTSPSSVLRRAARERAAGEK